MPRCVIVKPRSKYEANASDAKFCPKYEANASDAKLFDLRILWLKVLRGPRVGFSRPTDSFDNDATTENIRIQKYNRSEPNKTINNKTWKQIKLEMNK